MSIKKEIKKLIRNFTPPIIFVPVNRLLVGIKAKIRGVEYEYLPEGWVAGETDAKIKGWNEPSILEVYKTRWPFFLKNIEGAKPFCCPPESLTGEIDICYHNAIMSYGYSLFFVSQGKTVISMLDWGGGIGHYYAISQVLAPGLEIDYHCKDVPVLAEYGQKLFPQAHFYSGEECCKCKYDLVLASTSLHYSRDWQAVLQKLANATDGCLFITQLPVVLNCDSYVMIQKSYKYGYNTEYLGWCLNRDEFLKTALETGLKLVREFIIGYRPFINRAPEQCEYRGFLFKRP